MFSFIGNLISSNNNPTPPKQDPIDLFKEKIVQAHKDYETIPQPALVQAALRHFKQDVKSKDFTAQRLMGDAVTKTAAYQKASYKVGLALFGPSIEAREFACEQTISFYFTSRKFALWLSALNDTRSANVEDEQLELWMTSFTSMALTSNADGVVKQMGRYQEMIEDHLDR